MDYFTFWVFQVIRSFVMWPDSIDKLINLQASLQTGAQLFLSLL